ncbi:hypothetical protein P691DRAFT_769062 [Macrolepiota fuliginosa MF-IS2]|uniref:Uncharacterized protein n=1 Tax=Macrolepiota fuliginosa MF-IS2 TaxID=1400762 RepID=A0A9P5WVW9_9AGAR|nr:hypothetical protein P691DRAFT_769062 [Macrolepiota fuliginosa MF-IS2]
MTDNKLSQAHFSKHNTTHKHHNLKVKWTTTLEECCACALNPTVVAEYFDMLGSIIHKYQIPHENIYNTDEKGVQLGIGQSVAAIIDCNQKSVQQVENGNWEMVTIIEAICADGSALPPSVIFQGQQ